MSSVGWVRKDAEVERALQRARERRMCLAANTQSGVKLLERRVDAGELTCVFPHLYEEGSYWMGLPRTERALRIMRGAALLHPDWIFCSTSAALAYGLQVSQPAESRVHIVTSRQAHTASSAFVVRHIIDAPPAAIADGVRVVDLATCVVGCLRDLDFPHGLAVADSFLRNENLEPEDLERLANQVARGPRRSRVLRAARAADPRAENGGESVARGVMIELGYQTPDLQVELPNPLDQAHSFRVDFMWGGNPGPISTVGAGDQSTLGVGSRPCGSTKGCGEAFSPVGSGNRPLGGIGRASSQNVEVCSPAGGAVSRPLIIGELDGLEKYENPSMLHGRSTVRAFSDERLRESRLTISGARVMRFRFEDVLDRQGFARLLNSFGVPKVAEPEGSLPV